MVKTAVRSSNTKHEDRLRKLFAVICLSRKFECYARAATGV
jgi:hypothetical protein